VGVNVDVSVYSHLETRARQPVVARATMTAQNLLGSDRWGGDFETPKPNNYLFLYIYLHIDTYIHICIYVYMYTYINIDRYIDR